MSSDRMTSAQEISGAQGAVSPPMFTTKKGSSSETGVQKPYHFLLESVKQYIYGPLRLGKGNMVNKHHLFATVEGALKLALSVSQGFQIPKGIR